MPIEHAVDEKTGIMHVRRWGKITTHPVAIVVSNDVEYGMARMYMGLTELKHTDTMIFRSYDNALKWLAKQSKNRDKIAPIHNRNLSKLDIISKTLCFQIS